MPLVVSPSSTTPYSLASKTVLQVPKVMAFPPTLGTAASATSIASPQIRATSPTATNVELNTTFFSSPVGGAWAKAGTTYPNYNYVITPAPVTGYGSGRITIEFMIECLTFEFMYSGNSSAYRLWVDGELVSATATAVPNTGGIFWQPVTFATRALRHIVIETNAGFRFGGVTLGPNDTIFPAPVRRPKCIIFGDSFTEGTGGTQSINGFAYDLANRLGWDVWGQGQGGSGYNAVGNYTGNFMQRIPLHAAIPFDVVLFCGGYNDNVYQYSSPTYQAEVEATFALAKATWPKALIIASSTFCNKGVEGWGVGYFGALHTKILAAATNQNVMHVDLLEMPFAASTTVSGTLTATKALGSITFSSTVALPVGGTVEIGTGLTTVERRIVTVCTGTSSPYTLTVNAVSGAAHNSGEIIKQVGTSLWTGTGKVGTPTGTGNSDLYVSSSPDGTHPSDAGHAAIGLALATAISAKLKDNA